MSRYNINPNTDKVYIDTTQKVKHTLEIMQKAFMECGLNKNDVGNNVCLAFSGGKDSIVVAYLAKVYFGVDKGLCEQSFCFPNDKYEFKQMGEVLGLDITFSEILTDEWLIHNPHFIFCNQKLGSKFYLLRQQTAVREYSEGNNKHNTRFKAILTGRRNQENSIRKDFYTRKNGIMQIHPLRYWETREIWSFILENNLPYPSIYTTELGLAEGATPWCNVNVEKAGGRAKCWEMIYNHNKSYFTNHIAKYYDEAQEWLQLGQKI